jgi:two-component system cell cycle response regulator
MRAQEVLARSGGDEFIVICPDTSLEAALACAERMRAAAAAQPIVGGAQPVHQRQHRRCGARCEHADSEALIRLADQSAYLAKRNRNSVATMQTVSRPSLVAQGLRGDAGFWLRVGAEKSISALKSYR